MSEGIADWVKEADIGEDYCYVCPGDKGDVKQEMNAARNLSRRGFVLLFQFRDVTGTYYYARRISPLAARFIGWVSSMTPAPYNPLAADD